MSYTLMWSPNTARVLASLSSIGVPVNPMNEAFGQGVPHVPGEPINEVVLTAVRLVRNHHMFFRSDNKGCCVLPFSGKNFWMVVKMMCPASTASFARRSGRSSACSGADATHRRNGRRFRTVDRQVVAVRQYDDRGVAHGRLPNDPPGIERHRQALARPLGVPDDADTPISYFSTSLPACIQSFALQFGRPQCFRDGRLDRVELVMPAIFLTSSPLPSSS